MLLLYTVRLNWHEHASEPRITCHRKLLKISHTTTRGVSLSLDKFWRGVWVLLCTRRWYRHDHVCVWFLDKVFPLYSINLSDSVIHSSTIKNLQHVLLSVSQMFSLNCTDHFLYCIVCILFSKHTFNTLQHKQREQSMCSEGCDRRKALTSAPKKHLKTYKAKTKNFDCVDRNPGLGQHTTPESKVTFTISRPAYLHMLLHCCTTSHTVHFIYYALFLSTFHSCLLNLVKYFSYLITNEPRLHTKN